MVKIQIIIRRTLRPASTLLSTGLQVGHEHDAVFASELTDVRQGPIMLILRYQNFAKYRDCLTKIAARRPV